jgi:hypothetical protein
MPGPSANILLAPPPRTVRQTGRAERTFVFRLLMIPHAIVGVGTLLYTMFLVSLVLMSEPKRGEIVGKNVRVDDRDTTYLVRFAYTVDGRQYEQSTAVTEEEFGKIGEGESLTIRVHPWAPSAGSYLAMQNRWGQVIMMTGFTLFWNGILATFAWMLIVKPARRRSLIVHGVAVSGLITRREIYHRRGGGIAVVTYTYPVAGAGNGTAETLTGRMEVPSADAEALTEGESTVVLYDGAKPARSVLFANSGYDVVSAGGQ